MKELPEQFPKKPPGKTGWPWDLPSDQAVALPEMTAGVLLPKISIITPSFNQGHFIEETIRSVLMQGYPNLEYIVIDGGSGDESVPIITKYQAYISYWESTPDRGQAHAINKGFDRYTGELVGWINSDDLLLPGALYRLALAHIANPERILLGSVIYFYEGKEWTRLMVQKGVTFRNMALLVRGMQWFQPGTFVPGKCIHALGLLDESLRYFFDRDLMCRLLKVCSVSYLPEPVAMFRLHESSKTIKEIFSWLPEEEIVTRRYWEDVGGINKPLITAQFELKRAALVLGVEKWNRKKGILHIRNALSIYPPILFSFKTIGLLGRCILPFQVFLMLRSLWGKVHQYYG